MKQTNNALNFLNSSYQAVYKHAYFAGIASSFAMIAVSPYVMAAGSHNNSFADEYTEAKDVNIKTGSTPFSFNKAQGFATSVTLSGADLLSDQGFTIETNNDNSHLRFTKSFEANTSYLLVSGSDNYGAHLIGSFSSNDPIKGSMTFNGSNLTITKGTVEVNEATFSNSPQTVIGGKVANSGSATQDLFINYSALRTGLYGRTDSTQAGKTSLNYVNFYLDTYSALDSMGEIDFDNGLIYIRADHDSIVEKGLGEIAAKAIIRAEHFDISPSSSVRYATLVVNKDKAGAIYADKLTLDGATSNNSKVTIDQNAQLQIAGNINQIQSNSTPPREGLASGTKSYIDTSFDDGQMNFKNGFITVNIGGSLILGANNVTQTDGIVTGYSTAKYDVNQTGGLINNYGTLQLGEALSEIDSTPLNSSNGATVYTLDGGSLTNTGTIEINRGSKLLLISGTFDDTKGSIEVNSGGILSVDIDAVVGKNFNYSVTDGQNILTLNVDKLANLNNKSGGTVELTDGVFIADQNSGLLGTELIQAFVDPSKNSGGSWIINDATLQLANTDLDLSSETFATKKVQGSGSNAVLQTDGKLTYTALKKDSGTAYIDSLGGFTKIQGGEVVFTNVLGKDVVWLQNWKNETERTFAATKYVSTSDGSTLAIMDNITLELTTQQFQDGVTDLSTANSRNPTDYNNVDTDLYIGSGGTLKVVADPWNAKNLSVDSGGTVEINGLGKNTSKNAEFNTFAKLKTDNFKLQGNANLKDGASLQISNTFDIGSTGTATFGNQTQLIANTINLSGDLTFIDGASGSTSTNNLNTFAGSSLRVANGSTFSTSNVNISGSTDGSSGSTLSFTGSEFNVGGDIVATGSGNGLAFENAKVFANDVLLSLGTTMRADSSSQLTFKTLHTSGTNATDPTAKLNNQVTINGSGSILTINGDGDVNTADLSVVLSLTDGAKVDFTDATDTLGLKYVARTNDFTLGDQFQKISSNASTIRLDMSKVGISEIDSAARDNLFAQLTSSDDPAEEPYFILDGITFSDIETGTDDSGNSIIDFDKVKNEDGNLDWNFEGDNTQESILINVNTNATIAGGFKAVETSSGTLAGVNVAAGKTLNIHGNKNGNIIANQAGQTVGANLGDKANLGLFGSGSIGEITGSGNITVGQGADIKVVASADSSKPSKIVGSSLSNAGTLNVDDIEISTANLQSGSALTTTNLKVNTKLSSVGAKINADTIDSLYTELDNTTVKATNFSSVGTLWARSGSDITVSDTLKLTNGMNVLGDTKVKAENILLTGKANLNVGSESPDGSVSSSGKLVVNQLDLNGNNLILDPEFGKQVATVFVKSFADLDNSDAATGADGVLNVNGNILVGRNSAFGLGGEESDFTTALAQHQDKTTGSLKENEIGALAFINQSNIALNGHKLIVTTATVDKLKELASGSDTIYLSQNAGLQIGTKALQQLKDNPNDLIFNDLDKDDTIKSESGSLIVPAGTTNEELARIFGTEVTLADGSVFNVTTDNGTYSGVIDSWDDLSGDSVMQENANARQILNRMSNPTFNYYSQKFSADNELTQTASNVESDASVEGAEPAATAETAATTPAISNTQVDGSVKNMAFNFIRAAGSEGDGAALEHAARFGALGVGVQVANQVTKASANAIAQRMSMEPDRKNPNMGIIDNGNAAMWLSSVYQDFNADQFGADNLNYGSDIDLYGLAVGFDVNVGSDVKLGAMVNVGQGDATGTGVAAGIQNDFKYYGAGIFASAQPFKDLTLTADVTYTKVDNELTSDSNLKEFGNLTSNMDSSALSAGLTAEYNLNFGPLNVTPHAGVRYTRLDLDSYSVQVDGFDLAYTDTEAANVISVPVGISLSTTIQNNDWIIQPSADFTVTKNFGDDSLLSVTAFDQQAGDIKYNTEFIDSITYGANAGIQIRKGSFSIGADAGYTKSSNTGELTVGANARFLF